MPSCIAATSLHSGSGVTSLIFTNASWSAKHKCAMIGSIGDKEHLCVSKGIVKMQFDVGCLLALAQILFPQGKLSNFS